ncbi:hypothetical protein PSTG_19359 [Puccinia striiformis f. sp. tritici PST-78]|uniref:Uncharacterized protein n=1 Tax=Puccinia striiformis f. sp. tritici PST-78 TaxID=1165861 RepID=A0A0L0UJY4_9BASI|nr:hypothetical protein PSTG_19359 [Puccinia striiformis f. sp. tritici PST-78]
MVLHPSFKDEYFKLAEWKPDWITESIRLTREMWETSYKTSISASQRQADQSPCKASNWCACRAQWSISGAIWNGISQCAYDVACRRIGFGRRGPASQSTQMVDSTRPCWE